LVDVLADGVLEDADVVASFLNVFVGMPLEFAVVVQLGFDLLELSINVLVQLNHFLGNIRHICQILVSSVLVFDYSRFKSELHVYLL